MNKKQEAAIAVYASSAEDLFELAEQLWNEGDNALSEVRDELEDAYQEMSEKIQDGAKGQMNRNAHDGLQEAIDALESAKDSFSEALDKLRKLVPS